MFLVRLPRTYYAFAIERFRVTLIGEDRFLVQHHRMYTANECIERKPLRYVSLVVLCLPFSLFPMLLIPARFSLVCPL
ncbi:hypothetical protein BDV29DRAFT_176912 [Aspergillus leporis]|jgi:hypothetical protein|uniref:Uncharacterized protein n=1 Tax=Aspergillus leporis TaxID=41062 RepID=A0A5N5WVU3_9EURO|nr:hypothetical protein BDV29DRAFT_176912 [Aspergillus leporis]